MSNVYDSVNRERFIRFAQVSCQEPLSATYILELVRYCDALAADLQSARAELRATKSDVRTYLEKWEIASDKLTASEAECAKLRELLRQIDGRKIGHEKMCELMVCWSHPVESKCDCGASEIEMAIRAALASTGDAKGES